MNRSFSVAAAALPVLATAALTTSHVHVRGTARIDAHAARASGKLVVSGTVLDDTARPIQGARVAMSVTRAGSAPAASGASGTMSFASPRPGEAGQPGASPEPCAEGGALPALESPESLVLPTDDAARFCVRLPLPLDRYVVHLVSRATGLVDGTSTDLSVDLAREPVTLRFDPERPVLSLDSLDQQAATGSLGSTFEVVASTEDDGVTTAAAGLPLSLANEAGTALGSAVTNASGRARFEVEAARLGPPGRGELRVSFAGNADAGASTQTMQVERRTRVDLVAPDAVDGKLPAGSPEDGVAVRVVATPRCARRGRAERGGTPTGTVEARIGEAIVGAAPLVDGTARLVVTFGMPAANEVPLRLRYVSDAPWFQSGGEIAATLPVRAPSPWKRLPLVLACFVAIAWLVVVRLPAKRRERDGARSSHAPPARPEAGVELVRAGPAGRGWTGRLHDAHEGTPVAGARVAVERPGFERIEVLEGTVTRPDGTFALAALQTVPGDVLVAEGPLHAALRRPLPPPGELDVALVLRRRALLDRLVAWARARGRPFDARPEPTPAQVRRAAVGEFAVARWADAVERAAYGGAVVDARAEEEVDRLAPGAKAAERAEPEKPARPPASHDGADPGGRPH